MEYIELDMSKYSRKAHFDYFRKMAYPYVGFTANVDVTDFVRSVKKNQLPFFLSLCYAVAQAANTVPELRQRIMGDGIIQYDWCQTSHTLALDDGTYCYCRLESDMNFKSYLRNAVVAQERARQERSLDDGDEADSLLFISTVPDLSYTALVQPVPSPADCNPRITWGKYFQQGDRLLLPLSILCHHALVDGSHIARFYANLDMAISSLT
jgi:chloramphenicol O-acetyltransferase type A